MYYLLASEVSKYIVCVCALAKLALVVARDPQTANLNIKHNVHQWRGLVAKNNFHFKAQENRDQHYQRSLESW